jgi:hypothetical protein
VHPNRRQVKLSSLLLLQKVREIEFRWMHFFPDSMNSLGRILIVGFFFLVRPEFVSENMDPTDQHNKYCHLSDLGYVLMKKYSI